MRVLIAPDKFKGCLGAAAVAQELAKGWKAACPRARIDCAPLADGGDGFLEAVVAAARGRIERVRGIEDARFRKRTVPLGWIDRGRTAVVELAQVCGLAALAPEERNPEETTTLGLGRLIRHAAARGARRILCGLGGSATNDGGIGLATGLGFRFLDAQGRPVRPTGGHLERVVRIDPRRRVALPPLVAAVDVTNPLWGPEGAARVFARQKGADAAMVRRLERGLRHWAGWVGPTAATVPGAGAAGGAAYGLLVFCGAEIRPGFDLVAEALQLEKRILQADVVVTGEGCLDAQTALGKAPERMRRLARRAGRPVLAVAGMTRLKGRTGYLKTIVLRRPGMTAGQSVREAPQRLRAAGRQAAEFWTTRQARRRKAEG